MSLLLACLCVGILGLLRSGVAGGGPASPPPEMPCLPEVAANRLWLLRDPENDNLASVPCNQLHRNLSGGVGKRTCSSSIWSRIDFSDCSLVREAPPFFLLWVPLMEEENQVLSSVDSLLADLINVLALQTWNLQVGTNLILEATSRFSEPVPYTSVQVFISLSQIDVSSNQAMQMLEEHLPTLLEVERLGGLMLLSPRGTKLGYRGFVAAGSCSCMESSSLFRATCVGKAPVSPCVCSPQNCQCREGEYVGDGNSCTPDNDGDSFPAVALETCTNSTSQMTYCGTDNCPLVYNPDQNLLACQAPPNFDGCLLIQGVRLNVVWANTERGAMDRQKCPNAQGFVTRRCQNSGQWEMLEDVTMCMSYDFDSVFTTANGIFTTPKSLRDRLMSVSDVTDEIVSLTGAVTSFSLLPTDLNSTNRVLAGVIELLEESLTSTEETNDLSNTNVLDIFSNVLEEANLEGWLELTKIGEGTPKLLDNVERYALYQSRNVNENDTDRRLWMRNNIAINFLRVTEGAQASVKFPESVEDLSGSLGFDFIPAQVELPPTIFRTRRTKRGSRVPASSFLVRNMEMAMPTETEDGRGDMQIASMIISAQVDERGVATPELSSDPVKLTFQFDQIENATTYKCAYWKFSNPVGNGFWAYDGVIMTSMQMEDDKMTVKCSSTHLTSFAILVDVSGSQSGPGISAAEAQALKIVSYVGCAISIIFLLLTIIFFLSQGRELCVKVHYFVHLNLAISLCLAYIVFVAAGETAIRIEELCTTVAVVLHYLFLSAFHWMLCEGIMIYLLLVVVFSRVSKNIWFFLLIGYALPIVPVVITVGVRHENYGVTSQDGNLTFCWLSTENGVIWGFTGPMLAIIIVNLFFLVAALVMVYKTKRKARLRSLRHNKYRKGGEASDTKADNKDKDDNVDFALIKTLFVAVVVLLPMLGLTWVLGLFAVNSNTTFFAWIFAIVNSLQGFFIFLFHVVKSDKVWKNPHAVNFRSRVSFRPYTSTTRSSDLSRTKDHLRGMTSTSTSKVILLSSHSSTADVVVSEDALDTQDVSQSQT